MHIDRTSMPRPRYRNHWRYIPGIICLVLIAYEAFGEPSKGRLDLAFPVDCNLGDGCGIVKYFDLHQGPEQQDYMCGALTNDGHKAIDIALQNIDLMNGGVDVIAAESGRIYDFRDGVADENVLSSKDQAFKRDKISCGNFIAIDHGDGWFTKYCHMRYGSIEIFPGSNVRKGEKIGEVGMSGYASFPHLHFSLWKNGVEVDPISGKTAGGACAPPLVFEARQIGLLEIEYEPAVILDIGISEIEPKWKIRDQPQGDRQISASNSPIFFWAEIWGLEDQDQLEFRLTNSNKEVKRAKSVRVSKTNLRRLVFVKWKSPSGAWPAGTYHANVKLRRQADSNNFETTRKLQFQID